MDALAAFAQPISPVALGAILVTVLLVSLVAARLIGNAFPGKKPPIMEGLPFVGGLLKFLEGPWALLSSGYKAHGEVFTVPVFHKRITILLGPHATPHFFKATDDEMSQYEVYKYSIATFGKGVVYDVDHKVRVEQFRFFSEALRTDRLRSYVPLFVQEAEQFFASWGEEGVVDLADEFAKLIMCTASRSLLGREAREQMFDEVVKLLHELDDGMVPLSVVWPNAPIKVHAVRDKARERLRQLFKKVIEERRASGVVGNDVLQSFIDAKYLKVYGGRGTTPDECIGLCIAALFAGQHTSGVTSAWTGFFMMDTKADTWEPAVQEQRRIMAEHGDSLDMEVLNKMEVLHRNIQEAIRIHPALILLFRYAKKAFSVTDSKGREFYIPKGDIVGVSPNYQHMMPGLFKDPEKYDPSRYLPPRSEDAAKPFTYIGFGGGRHACMGQNFAYLQIKAVWSVALRNFDMELVDPVPEANHNAMIVGPKPCRIRYRRRKLTPAA